MPTFAELGAREPILQALVAMGYETPTEVQARALPVLLSGRDALIEAETGSGKTAAFGILAVRVGSEGAGLRVLVLTPTRELARQVADEIRALGTGSPFRCVAVTGGVLAEEEERQLGGDVRCIVATPGRLLALVEAGKVRLDRVQLVVLDEADRMLDMGFRPDAERVLDAAKSRAQTVLVSATLPAAVRELASAHLRDPVEVHATATAIPRSLQHHRLNVFDWQKEDAVVGVLRAELPERAIVFARTRERAAALAKALKERGVRADALQGEMSHDQRRHVFDLFQRGITRVLVATDLASRGLDVPEMDVVVNYDLPDEDETYLHRAGRAGRMGKAGKVVTLVRPDEKARRIVLETLSGGEWAPYKLDLPRASQRNQARGEAPATGHEGSPAAKGAPTKRGAPGRRPPPRKGS